MEFELVEEESYNSQLVESSLSENDGEHNKVYIKEQNRAKLEVAEEKLRALSRSTLGRVVAEPSSSSHGVRSDFTFTDDEVIEEIIDLTVPVTYRVKFNFSPEK